LLLGLDGKKLTLNTVSTKKNIISGFWSYLVDKGYVNRNVVTKSVNSKYKAKDKEVEVPTDEELEAFISNIYNIKSEIIAIRDVAIVKLLKGSGIREEELVGLDIGDIYFNTLEPHIKVLGKGNQGEENKDKVPVSQEAIEAVNEYLKYRNELPGISDINALFISEKMDKNTKKRRRITESAVKEFFDKYSGKTIHPHMLRHYVGTKMYENTGHDIVGVSKQLRHKSVVTTSKAYVKENKEKTYAALNSF
jgi:site-specific recombinase XerC